MPLTWLEDEVIRMLLKGEHAILATLREQTAGLRAASRDLTGVGFFIRLVVRKEAPRIPGNPSFKLGDISGSAAGVRHGLGFLLYVNDGSLSALEGYTYDEPWPDEVRGLKLSYLDGPDRNLASLNEIKR